MKIDDCEFSDDYVKIGRLTVWYLWHSREHTYRLYKARNGEWWGPLCVAAVAEVDGYDATIGYWRAHVKVRPELHEALEAVYRLRGARGAHAYMMEIIKAP